MKYPPRCFRRYKKNAKFVDGNKTTRRQGMIVQYIRRIIDESRANAVRSVDFCRVQMYWHIGQRIVEEEQCGEARAEYGKYIIRNLSKELMPEYGSGFGVRQLERARRKRPNLRKAV
jgi:hypothetical protein